jgi:hypothetical protein
MSIDRRSFLLLWGAAGAGRLRADEPPRQCVGNDFPQVPPNAFRFDSVPDLQVGQFNPKAPKRPLWSKLDDGEKARLGKDLKCAYARMMNRRWTNRRSYMYQAWTHAWYCGGDRDPCFGDIHLSWAFLPWHRAFLYLHEKLIQEELGNSEFRLPVWDWEKDPKVPWIYNSLPSVKHLDCNCSRAQDHICPVTSGQLDAWFGSSSFDSVVGGLSYPGTAFGGLHQCVHVQLGGCMRDFLSAALDPVFFAHHANVDRFWDSWAAQNRSSLSQWPASCLYFYDRGRTVRVKVQDLLETTRLGYRYDRPFMPKSVSVNAIIDNGLVKLDDCAFKQLSNLLSLDLGSDTAGQIRRANESGPPVTLQFRVSLPQLEHGKYYLFGIQNQSGKPVVTLDPCAGLLGMHQSPSQAVIAAHADRDALAHIADKIKRGIQLVYGPASNTSGAACGGASIADGHATPFTPESFEVRVATAPLSSSGD